MTETPSPPPPPGSRLRLPTHGSVREAMVVAYRSIIDYAVASAARGAAEPVSAVHEFRKSLRRGRSLIRLARGALPEDVAETLSSTLRDVARSVSALRDRAVAPMTLDALPFDGELAEAAHRVATAVRAGAEADTSDAVAPLLAAGAAVAAATVDGFEQHLGALDWREVRRGLRRSFRRARRSRHDAGRSDEATHEWRKRAKEVAYQLELLAGEHEGPARALRRVFGDLAELLGEAVDLAVARELVLGRRAELGHDLTERLAAAIDVEGNARRRAARKLGRELFEKRPRRFARRAIRDARDARDGLVAPPAPEPADPTPA